MRRPIITCLFLLGLTGQVSGFTVPSQTSSLTRSIKNESPSTRTVSSTLNMLPIESASSILSDASLQLPSLHINLTPAEAEALAGPFFGLSLFPYLAFIYFLNVPENDTPKGVTIGFATCLLFVFLTIPAAIAAQVLYGVSLADSDWLHGSAESLLTMTNLVTVVAFRQALAGKERQLADSAATMPISATSYTPMVQLVGVLTFLAGVTALVPAMMSPEVHTPYLGGFMDLPADLITYGHPDPPNSLTVAW